jgi:hypothetical protein
MIVPFLELDDERHRLRAAVAHGCLVVLQPCGPPSDLTEYLPRGPVRLVAPAFSCLWIVFTVEDLEPGGAGLLKQRDAVTRRCGDMHSVGSERECTVAARGGVPLVAESRVVMQGSGKVAI